jgi:hypothetical protein
VSRTLTGEKHNHYNWCWQAQIKTKEQNTCTCTHTDTDKGRERERGNTYGRIKCCQKEENNFDFNISITPHVLPSPFASLTSPSCFTLLNGVTSPHLLRRNYFRSIKQPRVAALHSPISRRQPHFELVDYFSYACFYFSVYMYVCLNKI